MMRTSYIDGKWEYKVSFFDKSDIKEECFPEENYDFFKMKENSIFIGAYYNEKCIGLAILQDAILKYMYLYDLKVCKEYRRCGIGHSLIEKSMEICKMRGYIGLYTQGQDNNLGACLFYLKNGFYIGGLTTNLYKGTKLEGTADIIFYKDLDT